ncbi:diguanylate cyclase (GGDEF) domain-containing protein [Modicisalibacter muralis]|uniref:diguanylate cyclase n=1 Tax=Modicisalibacter muralis TaxID=119000 RepID=A0A1G9FFW5_9GAMM|nr:diguanylate cyclase [Halomonas muralis]SDK87227.1 diguanylate cyclase (GGDEF) domain-containing protein [Halomonas muralis]
MTRILASLRYRFFLALGMVLLLALVALGIIAQQLVIPALIAKENEFAVAELDRARRAIDNELHHLSLINKDWATWDDSYIFMQNAQSGYLASNLDDALVFDDANLRVIIFLESDGTPYWITGLEPDEGAYTSCSGLSDDCSWAAPAVATLQKHIAEGIDEDTQAWLQAYPERSMVSVWPIVKSDGSGPARGWLAMIRIIDGDWLARLKEGTGIELALSAIETPGRLPNPTIERENSQTMIATRAIEAAPQGYHLEMQATLPRQSFKASIETFRFALYWTIGLLVVVVVVVLILLERMVLAPLRQFATFTQHLQKRGSNASDTPPALLARRDEIGMLAREFQHLIDYQQRRTSTLIELSQRDPLTGLANRRLFDEHLGNALDAARNGGWPVALLMVDIDNFKTYNDHYGHPAGDACLCSIAEAMRQQFTLHDQLAARTGGEEFSIILPATTREAGIKQAESLRGTIERLALPHAASPSGSVVTISIGLALSTPSHPRGADSLIRAADSALYRAKQAGRNRVGQDALNALPE